MAALFLSVDVGGVGWPAPAQHPWRLADGDAGLTDRGVAGRAGYVLVAAGAALVVELGHGVAFAKGCAVSRPVGPQPPPSPASISERRPTGDTATSSVPLTWDLTGGRVA